MIVNAVMLFGGIFVFCSVLVRWLFKNKATVVAEPVKKGKVHEKILAANDEFARLFPTGVQDSDIVEKGEIIGRFMDGPIYSHLILSNGWKLEWLDVVRESEPGMAIIPRGIKNALLVMFPNEKLFYKLVIDVENNSTQVVEG
jgi:hypothetical protein